MVMKMKIALVNHNLGSGGAEKLIYDMSILLKEKAYQVDVVLLTEVGGVYDKKLQENGINVIHLSNRWDIYSPQNIYRLIKVLKNYDVVHTHTYASQLWVSIASLFLSKKINFVTTEHNTTNRRRGRFIFKYVDKFMYSRYKNIISITEEVKINLIDWIENSERHKVISNGINLKKYFNSNKISKEKLGLELEDILITMVARFSEQKDHMTLIKAIEILPHEYKLLLLGEGELKEKFQKYVNEKKLNEKIKFLGYRDDVPEILKTSDIGVLSSNYEGLPISLLEIMATGIPFVGSRVPGIKELASDIGVLFAHKNSEELAEKLKKLSEDRNYYEQVKNKCIKKAKDYDIENTTDKYITIYKGEKK